MAMNNNHHRDMQKVDNLLRNEERKKNIYDPLVVSFGPYHHGESELQVAEDFKSTAVDLFIEGSGKTREFFQTKVLGIIGDVRSCYLPSSTERFSDHEFTELMLRDACMLIIFIEMRVNIIRRGQLYSRLVDQCGRLVYSLMLRDMFPVENQIPYMVLKLLIYEKFGEIQGQEMVENFLSSTIFGDWQNRIKLSQQEPLHLLDAYRMMLVADCQRSGLINNSSPKKSHYLSKLTNFLCWNRGKKADGDEGLPMKQESSFRSATDLKKKGIHFEPSSSCSLLDIQFKPDYFRAHLQLPRWYVSTCTKVFFSNMIAYEIRLRGISEVSAYVKFMKNLIQSPADVKELRESNIIVNQLGSDEEVLQVFNDLDPFALGVNYESIFQKVMESIQQHYNSRAETWRAELIQTYFSSPWSAIALFAAVFLLCLTIAQTYFTVIPYKHE